MRSRLNILVAAAAMALVVPQFAMADSVEDQLRLMNERMSQMEEQLQATQDELDASQAKVERQEGMIEKAGLGSEAKSGLSGFYEQINVSGWLAASYFYNFSDPDSRQIWSQNVGSVVGSGTNGPVAPFHPDHNSFSVDQLWFEIEKPVSEESRAGFRADILYGKTAGILSGATLNRLCSNIPGAISAGVPTANGTIQCEGDSANDLNVYQAYVEYLTPFGPSIKAGKFGTLIGAEVVGTVYNYNITRSNVWTLLQPINHYGVLLDGQTEGGFIYSVGAINSTRAIDPDSNNDKSVIGRLGWGNDTFTGVVSAIYGSENSAGADGDVGTLNVLLNWDPTESFSAYLDYTHQWADNSVFGGGKGSAWGLALAGRYAITERLGFSLRGEVVQDENTYLGLNTGFPVIPGPNFGSRNTVWGITATTDYELAENLVVKAEVRYDHISCKNTFFECDNFISQGFDGPVGVLGGLGGVGLSPFTRSDQWLGGIEVVYSF